MREIILKTERCYVRELEEGDVAAEAELFKNSHMTDYIDPPEAYEEEVLLCREYAEKIYDRYGFGMWGIFDKETDALIGEAGLEPRFDVDRDEYPYDWMFEDDCAEIGFMIAEDLWGQGLCTEVCSGILDYCREHFGIRRVFAWVEEENVASVRVLEKLGFVRDEMGIYVRGL
ncbi:MAG: GNAT family N-acetyltransferase [Butyrivibrio sp.]|nr:GNAT family N-acetyltransferase [Butyrivibrio sp.]